MSQNTNIVPGTDWIGYVYDGGTWKPIVCCRSGNIHIRTDVIETTVAGSGNFKTFEPTVHNFDATFEGVCALSIADSVGIAELQAMQLAKTRLLWRFIMTNIAGDVYRKEAYFYITDSTDTGAFDGIATFQLSLQGTGTITQIFTPPSPTTGNVYRYPAMGDTAPYTPGAYTWETGLVDKMILNVVKDGRGSNNIILSGTPVGNEVLYDETTGDLTWAVPFEEVETPPYVEYQNT